MTLQVCNAPVQTHQKLTGGHSRRHSAACEKSRKIVVSSNVLFFQLYELVLEQRRKRVEALIPIGFFASESQPDYVRELSSLQNLGVVAVPQRHKKLFAPH